MWLTVTVLPAPDGPIRTVIAPLGTTRSTPSSTRTPPKSLTTPSSSIAAPDEASPAIARQAYSRLGVRPSEKALADEAGEHEAGIATRGDGAIAGVDRQRDGKVAPGLPRRRTAVPERAVELAVRLEAHEGVVGLAGDDDPVFRVDRHRLHLMVARGGGVGPRLPPPPQPAVGAGRSL